ncbi:MAG: type I DNA topoisomerase [Planctomycetes bacterium]|nr:type I DNA topoisomerase [Planctomycetota bacterium]
MADSTSKGKKKTTKKTSKAGTKRGKSKASIKNLVIVESPAKANTINKMLGRKFVVKSSVGHIRDLPKTKVGIEIEDDCQPHYVVMRDKSKIVSELRDAAKKAEMVFLAPDMDREGEAIAWHLQEALKLEDNKVKRVIFNEITKNAILAAFESPTVIDIDKVNAQQTRRILDRLVGYKISPLLWKKVKRGLSAGRVQSVAGRLICEREKLINDFNSHIYWALSANVEKKEGESNQNFPFNLELKQYKMTPRERFERWRDTNPESLRKELEDKAKAQKLEIDFSAENIDLIQSAFELLNGKYPDKISDVSLEPKFDLQNKQFVEEIVKEAESSDWIVKDVKVQKKLEQPRAPYITSTLQRAASNELHFSAKYTMSLAQALYEGVDVGNGPVGMITYMRTDSVRIASEALTEVRDFIKETFNDKYLPKNPRTYKTKNKNEQDAHECVRPTSVLHNPEEVSGFFGKDKKHKDMLRLYRIIWRQFVACQMSAREYNLTTIIVSVGKGLWKCFGREELFDGFTRLYKVTLEEEKTEISQKLPKITKNEALKLLELKSSEKTTSPPARYTEASLVKTLESEGIGRPSTYATILSNIQDRGYVELRERKFFATELGMLVNELLVENFPRELSIDFTSNFEEQLDLVEHGKMPHLDIIRNFWVKFVVDLEKAEMNMKSIRGKNAEVSDQICPKCGGPMLVRWSKRGKFLGCSKYPECEGILQINGDEIPKQEEPSEFKCEKCNSPMIYKLNRWGKKFLACSNYPECKNTVAVDKEGKPIILPKVDVTCDKCGKPMLVKRGKWGRMFLGCSGYPKCQNTMKMPDDAKVEKKETQNKQASKNESE